MPLGPGAVRLAPRVSPCLTHMQGGRECEHVMPVLPGCWWKGVTHKGAHVPSQIMCIHFRLYHNDWM